ncbi:MAG: SDR family NAD(P)-dependent oxidoreductase [Acidimicrobiia bacterium]
MGVLDGRVVIVTGAGRGAGEAYATLAAREGAAVVVNDVDGDAAHAVVDAITSSGFEAVAHVADIGSWAAADVLVSTTLDRFGQLDGLVNNAGLFHTAYALDQDEESFRRLLDVNVIGLAACGVHAMRHMVRQGSGSVVNVTSGSWTGMSGVSAYGASKGAVASLTYTWALELAGTGVRVNAISPLARTRMVEQMFDFHADDPGWSKLNLDHLPPPAANAPTVVYLLSDLANEVHGQIVRINVGELALMSHPGAIDPFARGGAVSIEAVADAFAGVLSDQLQPVGLHRTAYEPRKER